MNYHTSFRAWLAWTIEQARCNHDALDPKAAEILTNVLEQYDARISDSTPAPALAEELERLVELALHARVPGGSEVWVWLPQTDPWTPSETARDVMKAAVQVILSALRAPQQAPVEVDEGVTELPVEQTARGFSIARGVDRYGAPWSVQDSSLAKDSCIWLGSGELRAHLTQEMVASLLPLLQRFVATGSIAAMEARPATTDEEAEVEARLAQLHATYKEARRDPL